MRETNHGPQSQDLPPHDSEYNEPTQRVRGRIEHGIIEPLIESLGAQDGHKRFKLYSDLLSRLSSDRSEV